MSKRREYPKRYFVDHPDPDVVALERLRRKLDLSMQRVASLLGVSLRTYQRYVAAKDHISPSAAVVLLAKYLERFPHQHAELVEEYRKTHESRKEE